MSGTIGRRIGGECRSREEVSFGKFPSHDSEHLQHGSNSKEKMVKARQILRYSLPVFTIFTTEGPRHSRARRLVVSPRSCILQITTVPALFFFLRNRKQRGSTRLQYKELRLSTLPFRPCISTRDKAIPYSRNLDPCIRRKKSPSHDTTMLHRRDVGGTPGNYD